MPYLGGNSSNSVFKSFFIHKILVYPQNQEKNPKKFEKSGKNIKPEKIRKTEKNPRTPLKKSKQSKELFWVFKIRSP